MIRIFVGTSVGTDDKDAERVLEYSLRKNCSEEIDLVFMRNTPNSFFGDFNNETWWTPFSYLRWAIPEYCNFQGRAIYMDVDQVNFKNIAELFYMDLHGKPLAVREKDYRTCVMVLDCEKLKGLIPPVSEMKKHSPDSQSFLVKKLLQNVATYDARWNCLDGEDRRSSDIWHLHFTEMTTQPWNPAWAKETWGKKGKTFIPAQHPRGDLVYIWNYLLKECNNEK